MSDPAKLLVVFDDNNAVKLTFPSGIPKSMEELKLHIQNECSLSGDFRLQYMDTDFNAFLNLQSTGELKNLDKVKVIGASVPEPALPSPLRASSFCSSNSSPGSCRFSVDTDILSSSEAGSSRSSPSSLRADPWPALFPLPTFSYASDLLLKKANDEFVKTGALFTPPHKLKSDIMQSLASAILKYKPYPTDSEFDTVCKALIGTYPFLREQGSESGFSAWKITLKQKMGNYRSSLRNIGCRELQINSLKHRSEGNIRPNQVKKARRAEVNFCPDYPTGESRESQEADRVSLLSEEKKRNNDELIKTLMDKTFPHRRQEILQDMPLIADFRRRWPALFSNREINAEFRRITTTSLTSKFMSQLDEYAPKLIQIYRKKGGKLGHKITEIMEGIAEGDSIDTRRCGTLKALAVYLNEDPTNLIKEYVNVDSCDAQEQMSKTVIGIYANLSDDDTPEDVGIIIEGVTVLQDLPDVASAFPLLFGLTYVLNLNYPPDLKYTFEFFQKVLMELDNKKMSNKIQVLRNKLLE